MHPADLSSHLATAFEAAGTIVLIMFVGFAGWLIGKFNEAIGSKIIRRLSRNSHLRSLTTDGHRKVSLLMEEIRRKTGAARVCLYQFHNGDAFALGNHAWKLSCSHEVLRGEVRSSVPSSLNLPVGAMIDWVEPLLNVNASVPGVRPIESCTADGGKCPHGRKGHRILFFNIAEMNASAGQALANDQSFCYAFVVSLVDTSRGLTFGFLSIQFSANDAHMIEKVESDLCWVCPLAEQIQFFLTTDFPAYRARRGLFPWLFGSDSN